MNRSTLAAALLELFERSPLRPTVAELLEAYPDIPAEELTAALEELVDLAQIGAAPPHREGGKILETQPRATIRGVARARPRNCEP